MYNLANTTARLCVKDTVKCMPVWESLAGSHLERLVDKACGALTLGQSCLEVLIVGLIAFSCSAFTAL